MLTIHSQVKLKASKVIFQLTFNPKKKKRFVESGIFCLFKSTVVQLMSPPYGVSETLENAGVNNFLLRLSMETNK